MFRGDEIGEDLMVLCGDKVSAGASEEPFNMATVRPLRKGDYLCVSAGRGRCCLHKDRGRGVWVDLDQDDGVDNMQRVAVCGVQEE